MSLTPAELHRALSGLVTRDLKISVMVWGPPGVGKSSVVAQIASEQGVGFTDVRLSQLAPTDLRGLPVAENGVSKWYPPEFLPREGRGVLFLDEINMAPPTMQGMAQQLILDRRVGSYELPAGWFVWAAGNRKEDRASVFDMPAPLANRFLHFQVRPDWTAWRDYALRQNLAEHVIAFLTFRPELLHRLDDLSPAWPSPRSWEMASSLHLAGLDIAPAVGEGVSAEFGAFVKLYAHLPDLSLVLAGRGDELTLPEEPSVRYAAVVGLAARADGADGAGHAFLWLSRRGGAEWLQLFVATLVPRLRAKGQLGELATLMSSDPRMAGLVQDTLALAEG